MKLEIFIYIFSLTFFTSNARIGGQMKPDKTGFRFGLVRKIDPFLHVFSIFSKK